MERFVVRYRGAGSKPTEMVERIRALKDATIVDSSDRMLLVEASGDALRRLIGSSSDWLIAPEQHYELPEKPPRVNQ